MIDRAELIRFISGDVIYCIGIALFSKKKNRTVQALALPFPMAQLFIPTSSAMKTPGSIALRLETRPSSCTRNIVHLNIHDPFRVI